MPSSYPVPTQMVQQLWNRLIGFLMRSYPMKDFPLNIRPGMVFATAIWIILLGILGMAPLPTLPVNDKALHFFGLGFATFLLYFVLEVPEGPGRRIWYIRRAPLLLTLILAFFVGGIISEFVQSFLPWKEFQFGDIVANLCGSTLFLYLAHLLHQRNLRKMELSSLYQPLSVHGSSTYRDAQGRQHMFPSSSSVPESASGGQGEEGTPPRENRREREGSGVWDEDSDFGRSSQETARGAETNTVFELGDYDDDDHQPRGKNNI
ncbi:uncharacterized protein IL334_007545 [Kwoniella shivajii]|uniref:VanZ-like domain-containing protein n=1 Tax=Kwoniella shivajii TaxID=564305 RepID=A0ABZ1DAD4_9TREE|nr:hypothetical protein IL334_007545 [Kwoniella shivajii]